MPADTNILLRLVQPQSSGHESIRKAVELLCELILLEDSLETHNAWRKIVVAYGVSGVQVHDARLIAAMQVHRVPLLLTLNSGDFQRYSGITLLKPEDIIAG